MRYNSGNGQVALEFAVHDVAEGVADGGAQDKAE
jgi:hypothetical protein